MDARSSVVIQHAASSQRIGAELRDEQVSSSLKHPALSSQGDGGTRPRLAGESRAAYIARLCEPHVDNAITTLVELSKTADRESVRKDAAKDIVVLFADAKNEASKELDGKPEQHRVIYLVDSDKAQELLSAKRQEQKP